MTIQGRRIRMTSEDIEKFLVGKRVVVSASISVPWWLKRPTCSGYKMDVVLFGVNKSGLAVTSYGLFDVDKVDVSDFSEGPVLIGPDVVIQNGMAKFMREHSSDVYCIAHGNVSQFGSVNVSPDSQRTVMLYFREGDRVFDGILEKVTLRI